MVLAVLLPLVALQAQAPIDFHSNAAPLGVAIRQLSAQAGVKLEASPRIAHEVVYVRVKGVPLHELKVKLAEAVEGRWVAGSGGEVLTRTAEDDRRVYRRHVTLRRAYVDAELARLRKELEEPFDAAALAKALASLPHRQPSEPDAAMRHYRLEKQLFGQGPAARLLKRLLLACNPDDLASVGPYERVVFRIQPTRMQKGFDPTKLKHALEAFASEQGDWVDAAAKVTFAQNERGSMVSDPRTQLLPPATTSLRGLDVSRGDAAQLFNVNLIGSNQVGVLSQLSLEDPSRKYLDSLISAKPMDKDPEVALSPESQALRSLLTAMFGPSPATPLPRGRELLLNPDKIEPLSLVVSDVLNAYHAAQRVNVVAALPDEALSRVLFGARESAPKLFASLRALVESGALERIDGGGWCVMRPKDRFESAMHFTPRAPLAALMRSIDQKGRVDTNDYATYAFQSGRISRVGLGEWFMALLDRTSMGSVDSTDWNALRLYGSFTQEQRAALERGVKFPIGPLSSAQKEIVRRIVYMNSFHSLQYSARGVAQYAGQLAEPTELFVNGVPPTGAISARVQTSPVVVAYGRTADGKTRPLRMVNPTTVAHVEEHKDPETLSRYGVPGLAGYALGKDKMVALRVELAPEVWKEMPILVADYDAGASPVPWDKLPEPYQSQIRTAIEQVRAQKAQPGRTIPPMR